MAAKSRKYSAKLTTLQRLLYRIMLPACVFPHIIPYGISGAHLLLINPTDFRAVLIVLVIGASRK